MNNMENDSTIQVFDMIVERLSNIEDGIYDIKKNLIWKDRHQSQSIYYMNGDLYGFPFDIRVIKDQTELDIFTYKSYMINTSISFEVFKKFILDPMKIYITKIKHFSRNLLSPEQYCLFWDTINSEEYLLYNIGITCKELEITDTVYKYADDYILTLYIQSLCHLDFKINSMGFMKEVYFITKTSNALFVDEIIRELYSLLDLLGFRNSDINIFTVYTLNNKYENLYDTIMFFKRAEYSILSDLLRSKLKKYIEKSHNKISHNELARLQTYFFTSRFNDLIDRDELRHILINLNN
jgi:hypothetical protein